MIADSDYEVKGLILPPLAGAFAGAVAALAMLAAVWLMQPLSGRGVAQVLEQIGSFLSAGRSSSALPVGLLVHLGVGALCGTLYALSQQQAPGRYLLAVGVFYGLVIWVFSGLLLGAFSETLRVAFRNFSWLVSCLLYGVCLAGLAASVQSRRGGRAAVVPKD